jgi:hypothetical protein
MHRHAHALVIVTGLDHRRPRLSTRLVVTHTAGQLGRSGFADTRRQRARTASVVPA